MTIASLMNRPCTITHRTSGDDVDTRGNPIDTETTIETVCELQQRKRDEDSDRGEISRTEWVLFLPVGTLIGTRDTVVIDGDGYELAGDPWDVRDPESLSGNDSHIEATVVRVDGGAS